jgi:hypothetical protein
LFTREARMRGPALNVNDPPHSIPRRRPQVQQAFSPLSRNGILRRDEIEDRRFTIVEDEGLRRGCEEIFEFARERSRIKRVERF